MKIPCPPFPYTLILRSGRPEVRKSKKFGTKRWDSVNWAVFGESYQSSLDFFAGIPSTYLKQNKIREINFTISQFLYFTLQRNCSHWTNKLSLLLLSLFLLSFIIISSSSNLCTYFHYNWHLLFFLFFFSFVDVYYMDYFGS